MFITPFRINICHDSDFDRFLSCKWTAPMTETIPIAIVMVLPLIFFLGFVWKRMAARWNYLAMHFGQTWENPISFKLLQNGIIYGLGKPSQSYSGILSIGVFANGIGFKIVPPFGLFHAPLFIPFNQIKAWNQDWYINAESVELEFPNAPEVKIIMPKDQIDWIHEQSRGGIDIPMNASPNQTDIGLWKALAACYIGMTVLAVLFFGGQWALGLPLGI